MDKLKILIAEDDKLAQIIYEDGLPDDSYEKRFANNGEEAIEMYKSWKPDILVLDLIMPIKSGYAVLKEIRQMEAPDKATAIIIASSMADKEDILDCAKLGIQGYITKPIDPSKINDKISDYYQKFCTAQNNTAEPNG